MIIELIIALLLGVTIGCFSGVFPGIHINLVAAGLLALIGRGYLEGIAPIVLVAFIVAMAITHTFIDFIPSIFLGAPEEDSFLAVLPGHELLKKGKGFEAVVATLYGCVAALPFVLLFSFVFVIFLPVAYEYSRMVLPFILIFVSLFLIFREERFHVALLVFISAGVLGLLTFNLPVKEPLMPLLTGLFGISSLLVSMKDKVKIPEQRVISFWKIRPDRGFLKSFLAGGLVAPFFSFLPAIGSGQAAVVVSEISGKSEKNEKSFLFLVGMINVMVMSLSFVTLFSISKGRTGVAVAVGKILKEFTLSDLVLVLLFVFLSAVSAFFAGIMMGKFFANKISKLDYRKVSVVVIGVLFVVNLILSNFVGLILLLTASALGVFCILSGARRINLMGCLLIPTIVYYLSA